ncbi:phosphoribosylglycinamide formyltransferase [Bacillus infantis]|jgi:phosphoribosylglycinamide formyltransferase 1|uniref:phosphoribosylglycinamide formyltransferase n=1 Tax=Bacillus infantis TaxID=324767 RepID=UPI0021556DEF|nr:phosphoribosylglycinamide formyltransferase [Bacillus infantis]MCR6609005.1 phosphoribosylglycinamide formyltransferase [Bacillus infantis]
MKKIAVFASGSGTNFQAIIDAVKSGGLDADIRLLVSDRPGAYCLERAEANGVPSFAFRAKEFESKQAYEEEILGRLKESGAEFIILAGYMRLIGEVLLAEYEGRIVNIHPSLLPSFPGKDAIGQALAARVPISGVTVHYVDAGMDTGPIIAQQSVKLDEEETRESLQEKIHQIEHKLYPATLKKIFAENAARVSSSK